jgi:hypothetical protein
MSTVRAFALSLPETTEAPHHQFSSLRVRGRIFVTIPPGEQVIHVFVGEEDRERTLAMYPDWAEKLMWGAKALGLRITLAPAPAAVVKALVRAARDARAAKR